VRKRKRLITGGMPDLGSGDLEMEFWGREACVLFRSVVSGG
jgi:hypothetical protein